MFQPLHAKETQHNTRQGSFGILEPDHLRDNRFVYNAHILTALEHSIVMKSLHKLGTGSNPATHLVKRETVLLWEGLWSFSQFSLPRRRF